MSNRIETARGLLGTPEEETARALRRGERMPSMRDLTVRTVIDVGASDGSWVNNFIMNPGAYPDLKFVYCFEPHTDVFPLLEAHAKAHWVAQERVQCELYPYALGYKGGEASFNRMNSANYCSSALEPTRWLMARSPDVSDLTVVQVDYITLDDAVEEWGMPLLDDVVLKLDVQGYEERVLLGATKTLEKVSWVQAEVMLDKLYDEQATMLGLMQLLREHGFHYAGNAGQQGCVNTGSIMYVDALFVRCPPRSVSRG